MLFLGTHGYIGQSPNPTWYGPAPVTFYVQFAGDPYDPAQNDIHIRFVSPDGRTEDRIAYFDGTAWHATLFAHRPGTFTPVLIRNGKEQKDIPAFPAVVNAQTPLLPGFIHVDPEHPNRFLKEGGSPYVPVGYNLAWQNPSFLSSTDQIRQMGNDGLTWTRIWAANWDKRNPWWPVNDPLAYHDRMWDTALQNWDKIAAACDSAHLPFQITLFNHGSFSSTTDADWPRHPWNVANGGFLSSAADFFTNPEAKRRTKLWLRYAVARFSADPNLLAFELFNEVEWTDAAKAGNWPQIAAWHTEMATYIRTIDPYNHMITTSSTLSHPEIWTALDYYQPHIYNPKVAAAIASRELPKDKPAFYGEFGGAKPEISRLELRDALYESLFASTGGPAMYWAWDQVETAGYEKEFAALALAVKTADLAKDAVPGRFEISLDGGLKAGNGVGRTDWALARVQIPKPSPINLHGLITPDGKYTLSVINPQTAELSTETIEIKNNILSFNAKMTDFVIVLRRI